MSLLSQITPLLLTYNEAPNIGRTLAALAWAERIVVIDSFSTDETLAILEQFTQVEVLQRTFDTHANQWNFGLEQIQSPWVLSLDADYQVTPELTSEITHLGLDDLCEAYLVPFKYCVFGRPLRGTVLPPRPCLFQRQWAIYYDDGHTQQLHVQGRTGILQSYIYHDDRKPLSRWLAAQDRYMVIEVRKLLTTPLHKLSWPDRIRRTKLLAPLLMLAYCLILKGGVLDGWRGWYYAGQRLLAEVLLSLRLIEAEHGLPPQS